MIKAEGVDLTRQKALADTIETLTGTMFIDSGCELQVVLDFLDTHLITMASGADGRREKASIVQLHEWLQTQGGQEWKLQGSKANSGPDHNRTFFHRLELELQECSGQHRLVGRGRPRQPRQRNMRRQQTSCSAFKITSTYRQRRKIGHERSRILFQNSDNYSSYVE